jgi:hypothetical protein
VISARDFARGMRVQGCGYQLIADELGVVLSTAWRWCIGVPSDAADARRKASRVSRPMPEAQRAKLSAAMYASWSRRQR